MAVEQITSDPKDPTGTVESDTKGPVNVTNSAGLSREASSEPSYVADGETTPVKRNWYQQLWDSFKTPGSAVQIIVAALIAIAIGLGVSTSVSNMPEAVPVILEIPGQLWLRALRATGESLTMSSG